MNKSTNEKIKAEIEALKKEFEARQKDFDAHAKLIRERDKQIMELSNKKAKIANKLLDMLSKGISAAVANEEERDKLLFIVEGLSMVFKKEEVESYTKLLEYESESNRR